MKRTRRNAFDAFNGDESSDEDEPAHSFSSSSSAPPPPRKRRRLGSAPQPHYRHRPAPPPAPLPPSLRRPLDRFGGDLGSGRAGPKRLLSCDPVRRARSGVAGVSDDGSDAFREKVEDHILSLMDSTGDSSNADSVSVLASSKPNSKVFRREFNFQPENGGDPALSSRPLSLPEFPPFSFNMMSSDGDLESADEDLGESSFSEMIPNDLLLQNLRALHIVVPRPVQRRALPPIMRGSDVLIVSPPGTGKTLSSLVPLVLHCVVNRRAHFQWVRRIRRKAIRSAKKKKKKKKKRPNGREKKKPNFARTCFPLGLVLAPSRELASQLFVFARQVALKLLPVEREGDSGVVLLVGMSDKNAQVRKLVGRRGPRKKVDGKTPLIIVGTPGRILDFCTSREKTLLSMAAVSFFVCDEADQLLGRAFQQQVKALVSLMSRPRRQSVVISAIPLPPQVPSQLLRSGFSNVTMDCVASIPKEVVQCVTVVETEEAKMLEVEAILQSLVQDQKQGGVLLFASTKLRADMVADRLCQSGLLASSLHSGKAVRDRDSALLSFRTLSVQFLVCSDVAARGLDVPHVRTVVHVDSPKTMSVYASRIGRTCRRQASSRDPPRSYAFVLPNESRFASDVVRAFRESGLEPDDSLLRVAGRLRNSAVTPSVAEAQPRVPVSLPTPSSTQLPVVSRDKVKKPKKMVFYKSRSDVSGPGGTLSPFLAGLRQQFEKSFVYSGRKNFGSREAKIVVVPPSAPNDVTDSRIDS